MNMLIRLRIVVAEKGRSSCFLVHRFAMRRTGVVTYLLLQEHFKRTAVGLVLSRLKDIHECSTVHLATTHTIIV